MSGPDRLVVPLADPTATLAVAGGKGAALARLAAAGLPVPAGFQLTTRAYRRFVAGDLQREIEAAVAEADPDDAGALRAAAERIGARFAERPVPADIAAAVLTGYAELAGAGVADGGQLAGADVHLPVAVRSSATAEDLPEASFAGQQESYLNVRGGPALLDAVLRCWASLWTARAIGYRARHGIAPGEVSLAVVVQRMVPADAAGVLFTADPVTGAPDRITINAAWGLGESVVAGRVTPDTVVVDRAGGTVLDRRTADKTEMTVAAGTGIRQLPVDGDRRTAPVLDDATATDLARLGVRIELLLGHPVDVEWATHAGVPYVLQARPITGSPPVPPAAEVPPAPPAAEVPAEVWNDSLAGDFLWSSGNVGEAVPDVMTPCAWSLIQIMLANSLALPGIAGYPGAGNIGGRLYLNVSVIASAVAAFGGGLGEKWRMTEQVFGRLPDLAEIPRLPVSRWRILREVLPGMTRMRRRTVANQRRLAAFLAEAPDRCARLRAAVTGADAPALVELWDERVGPYLRECCRMLEAAARQDGNAIATVRRDLTAMVGAADAETLVGGSADGGELASLGPLLGLARLARGELDRQAYDLAYGHRSAHEFEVSVPRPAEDPAWLDARLAALDGARTGPAELLAGQAEARRAAWQRLRERHPGRAAEVRRAVDRWAAVVRDREAARSELSRAFWLARDYVLRAGAVTGRGDDLFFLSIDEIVGVLRGGAPPAGAVAARRAAYRRYRRLPPYPTLVRGRFDPVGWATDQRCTGTSGAGEVRGLPGAAGVVEGIARVVADVEDADRLRPGEVLVTTVTNIGWTPVFPRVAAVVTDVGAPLSHAAIVARELGIPAVVGCGDATARLRTGMRVRVDGAAGSVLVLDDGPAGPGTPPG